MKKNVRLLSLILVLFMLVPSMFACVNKLNTTAGTTVIDTTQIQTAEPSFPIDIISDNSTEYILIRPENVSDLVLDAALNLKNVIKEQTGADMSIKEDWVKDVSAIPESAKEIVIGDCNRPQSQEMLDEINQNDFVIAFEDDRIVIIGGSDAATVEGIEYFIAHYVDAVNKKITVQSDLRYTNRYDYFLGDVAISGGSKLREYTIIYPKNGSIYEKYAAENLASDILKNTGTRLLVTDDSNPEKQYEFLIGKTNRAASKTNVTMVDGQYVLVQIGGKVVMDGNSYMVGGAVGVFLNDYMVPTGSGNDVEIDNLPTIAKAETFVFKEAKSAILMIGDGMGFNHIEMALSETLDSFAANDLPNQGSCTTISLTSGYTDSAAAGTALATGYKTYNSYLGVDRYNRPLVSLRELAYSKGAKTAILTTDVLTGATPSAFLVHHNNRSDTEIIQAQIDEVIRNNAITYAKGYMGDDLINDTKIALSTISEGDNHFFAMIEGAYIDKYSHSNDKANTIMAVTRFNDSVAYTIEFVLCNPDTVLIITADHETGGITKNTTTGEYEYTVTTHTTTPVPVFAIGYGTEVFNNKQVDNTDIAKFIAAVYTDENFGQ